LATLETVTRFAPSPTGPFHLGHAYAALRAHDRAVRDGGRFLLRIEDIDGARSKSEFIADFRKDLAWLGLAWDEVPRQSTRLESYEVAVERLKSAGLLYPCRCTRAEIGEAAQQKGLEGPIYPGTCKHAVVDVAAEPVVWRLDVAKALEATGPLEWIDEFAGPQSAKPELLGDVVLVRKDAPASYHLAATLDDAADGVTVVTRGMDLFASTHVHRLLQALFTLPVPVWHHHELLLDEDGRKLSKRRGSPSLSDCRLAGEDGLGLAADLRAGRFPAGISLGKA